MQGTPSPNIFSVFGRFGAITAQSGDYTFAQIGSTPTTLSGYGITDAQALDADLTAIAGLSTTGTIERTGDGTASTYTVTAAAKTVLDDATVGDMLVTLGAQALDADLTAIAGLSTTGTIERTGAGTASTYTVTAAAKTVLDDATVGDMLTTLGGVGAASPTFTGVVTVPAGTVSAPGIAATGDSNTGIYFPAADTVAITEGGVEALRITDAGNLQFNSGYGSVATAYGCRAWVNFNGTGTVAIRASGNVSSVTDNGTGDYTVNFSTPMPDANFTCVANGSRSLVSASWISLPLSDAPTTTSIRLVGFTLVNSSTGVHIIDDLTYVNVAVFR